MKNRGTIILIVVVMALVFYAYWFEFRADKIEAASREESSRIVALKKDQIHHFKMLKGDDLVVELERDKDGWSIVAPIEYYGDQAEIAQTINSFADNRYERVIEEGDDIQWSVFGLENPKATFEFRDQNDQVVKVQVGTRTNFEAKPYLRIDSKDQVVIAPPEWDMIADKDLFYFQNKQFFRSQPAHVDGIQLASSQQGGEQFHIIKNESGWESEARPELDIDDNLVRDFLSELAKPIALSISPKPEKGEMGRYGFNSPQSVRIELDIYQKDENWQGIFAQGQDGKYYVLSSDPEGVFEIDGIKANQLMKQSLNQFRNKSAPFDFDIEKVHSFRVQREGDEDFTEMVLPELEGEQLAKLREVLSEIKALRVTHFDHGQAKEAAMTNELELRDSENELILGLRWGHTYEGSDKVQYAHILSSKVDSWLSVPVNRIEFLNLNSLDMTDEVHDTELEE